jgi:adenylylsulfate kinase
MSFVVWLTGLPSSGKTTIGNALKMKLKTLGTNVELLDGDSVRREVSNDLLFTKEDREIHAKRVVYLCKLLSRNGISSVVSLISPYREFRQHARTEMVQCNSNFVEVYVKCSLEKCIQRDRKGLYRKAINGQITDLTGLQSPYEEPLNPELMVDTEREPLEVIVDNIISKLKSSGYITISPIQKEYHEGKMTAEALVERRLSESTT